MRSSKSGPGSRSAGPPEAPARGQAAKGAERSVYFEFIPAGTAMRVTAIDAETGREVTIIGPAGAARVTLERTALAKLRYVLGMKR